MVADRFFASERVLGVRPSIDVALLDAASSWGDRVSAVILTGTLAPDEGTVRLGANIGYLKFTPQPTWNPF